MSAAMLTRTAAVASVAGPDVPRGAVAVDALTLDGSPGGRQLTRRARLVRTVVVGVVFVAVLIGVCAAVWSPTAAADEGASATGTVTVVVDEGDSLWSVVSERSYDRDPRAVMDEVRTLNGMTTSVIHPGQRLDLPAR